MRLAVKVTALFVFLLSAGTALAQLRTPLCRHGKGQLETEFLDFKIRIEGLRPEDAHDVDDPEGSCKAQVTSAKGAKVFEAEDVMMDLVVFTDDLNGDQKHDVAFEGFSGGAHCCFTLWVVSLADPPGLIQKIENNTDFSFARGKGGRVEIQTGDGSFDNFDSLSHADSPFPSVHIRLEGTKLIDAGPEHWADYEAWIAEVRKELSADQVTRFRSLKNMDDVAGHDLWSTESMVLEIALSYLYGGRQADAERILDEMWPVFDRERIWKLILKTRSEGILKDAVKHRGSRPPL